MSTGLGGSGGIPPAGIGETLRAARREQGVALSDAAAHTRIRESYLAALEEEDFGALGGDVYVKGFLRSYARFLNLDPEPLVDAYRQTYERREEPPAAIASQPLEPMTLDRRPALGIAALVALIVVLGLAFLGWRSDGEPAQDEVVAPPPVQSPVTPGPTVPLTPTVPTTPGGPAPTPEPAPTPTPTPPPIDEVVLEVQVTGAESWIAATVDGQQVMAALQSNGFQETFRGDVVEVRIGDAAAVEVAVNGEAMGRVGGSGQVVDIRCEVGATECELENVG